MSVDTSLTYTESGSSDVEEVGTDFSLTVTDATTGEPQASVTVTSSSVIVSTVGSDGTLTPILDVPLSSNPDVANALLAGLELLFLECGDLDVKFFKSIVDFNREEIQKQTKETLDKMTESLAKGRSAKKAGVWGKIFGWIATIVTVIAAAVLVVATFGAATPAAVMMCAAAALMLMNQISSETGNWLQEGMTKMCGGNAMAGMIVFMVIVLALSLGGAGVGAAAAGSAAAAAETTAATAATVAQTQARINAAITLATRSQIIASFASTGASLGAGITNYEKTIAIVNLQIARANLEKIQEIFHKLAEDLNAAIEASLSAGGEQARITKAINDAVIALLTA